MERSNSAQDTEVRVEERRETPRRVGQVKALISDAEGRAQPTPAWVIDRSEGGVCLSTKEPATTGTILSIRPATAPPETPWTPIEVKSCRSIEDTWELGCQFVRTPSHTTLLLFS